MATKDKKSLTSTRPAELPRWATVPSVDPVVGGSNVVEPPSQQKDTGYQRKQKPPANYTNWLFNTIYLWLKYFDEIVIYYGLTTGTQPAYIFNVEGITTYYSGLTLEVNIHATNTTASTININSLGVKNLRRSDGTVFRPGDLRVGRIYIFIYNGTEFVLPDRPNTGEAKAWVKYDGITKTILKSYNVSSVTYVGVGDYTINFGITFSDADYIAMLSANVDASTSMIGIGSAQTTTTVRVVTNENGARADMPIFVTAFGDLA